MPHSSNLIIISGPSGSGKDAVINSLIERGLPIESVITTVTRPKRESESEGNPYYFIDEPTFKELIDKDELAEWAQVDNGKYYGVTKTELARVKALKDKIGVWKIEWKGVQTVKKTMTDVLAILIEPPDIATLIQRSETRGQQTEQEIQDRISYSQEFLKHRDLYDYSVVNEEGKLEQTVHKVVEIIKKEGYATM
ncbi:MAG: hypothetical protein A3H70_00160 [Candidatus Komeilibacteria bacterium RIFCSPLOWO2_02_FULL_48_11]|uniref:Guanylate kinase-like domain-containing protein n=1 Tax=Candidatus Komeilibacteria bacterium RIFCSPLOWO2_02_FULL_48_11 TaxID=1798553 RepID=A0A1G2BQJ8_9BACT|nr:MAG: hypothetical protein A3H70_00160 [Candidatus Komeilibacteria bacterium RIFCSPLOWO2_02_FULL_48_11]